MSSVIPNIHRDKYEAALQRQTAANTQQHSSRSLENAVDEVRSYLTETYPDVFENTLNDANARNKIQEYIARYVQEKGIKVDGYDGLERTTAIITEDILDFGPITEYIINEEVEEIRVNSYIDIRIVVKGKEYRTDKRFSSQKQAFSIAKKIVRTVGKNITPTEPIVDARLKNGQRVAVVIEPVCLTGINLTIRKQKKEVYTAVRLIEYGTATEEMFELIDILGEADISIEVVGPTNSGKTATLQTILSRLEKDRRIITMEDTAELNLRQYDENGNAANNVLMWETKEGITNLLDLLRQSLRQSPETMVLGEMRGAEAQTVVAAANTGHQIYNSFHANGPKDAPTRVLQMYMMGHTTLTQEMILDMIITAFPICIFQKKLKDGSRKIMSISELEGYEAGRLKYRDIYKFKATGFTTIEEVHPLTQRSYTRKRIEGRHLFVSPISHGLYERLIEAGIEAERIQKFYSRVRQEKEV